MTDHMTGLDPLDYCGDVRDIELRFTLNFEPLGYEQFDDEFVDYIMSCVVNDVVAFREAGI